jgi:glycosyltransferase involved in cell wall biosynthesis
MLEAMAAGCLVLASKTQPVQEVIRDADNGLLFDFFDTEQLAAKAINALSAGRGEHLHIRQNARRTVVEKYDLQSVCLPAQLRTLERVVQGYGSKVGKTLT